jgi:hypothetical protein
MNCADILKRLASFALLHLLDINELRGQLSQSPSPANRSGGTAILAVHLDRAKRDTNDSLLHECTR